MAMMPTADMPCATRSGAGAALAGGGASVSLRQNPVSVVIPSQNATHAQVSGTGSCSMKNSTPRNTNNGGAAAPNKAKGGGRRGGPPGAANPPGGHPPNTPPQRRRKGHTKTPQA